MNQTKTQFYPEPDDDVRKWTITKQPQNTQNRRCYAILSTAYYQDFPCVPLCPLWQKPFANSGTLDVAGQN